MNVLYVSTKIIGSFPKNTGNISVVMPKYYNIPKTFSDKMRYVMHFFINIGWRSQYCGVFKAETDGFTVYFLENEYYFGEGSVIYGGECFEDEKYSYFARAVLEMIPKVGLKPDIIHTLDLKSAKICTTLEAHYRHRPYYTDIKGVATVQNFKYRTPDFFYTPENTRFWHRDTYSDISEAEYIDMYDSVPGK